MFQLNETDPSIKLTKEYEYARCYITTIYQDVDFKSCRTYLIHSITKIILYESCSLDHTSNKIQLLDNQLPY